ncbi:HNH endonuclease [Candidatus Peregrinibacteria bacterium]|nr:MAG: HNH endonuclease [Candidatus Peregrinibacteria bacterium]
MDKKDQVLHQQFSEYGRNAREWTRKCVLLLPQIERRQVWRKKGFGSIFEYAAKLAGMSRATVEEALRVLKKIENKAALQAVVAEKGLQRVRPVVSIATLDTADFWAEKARTMSKHSLETYVQNFRRECLPGEETKTVKLSMELSPETLEKLKRMKGDSTWQELMDRFLDGEKETVVSEIVPLDVKTKASSRHIPLRIQRQVRERSGGLCAYPGCSRRATSLHHTQRWALEKVHDPARLHALCTAHERLAHLGLIDNEEAPSSHWRLRTQPDFESNKRFVDQYVALYRPS